MRAMRMWAVVVLGIWAATAWAFDAGTGINVRDGAISLQTPVAVSNGGTGASVAGTDDRILVGTGSSSFAESSLPDCDLNGSQFLYDTGTNTFICQTLADVDIPNNITIDHSAGDGLLQLGLSAGSPSNEGVVQWDATNNELEIGDGASSRRFIPVGTTTAANLCSYDSGTNAIVCTTASASVNSTSVISSIGTISTGSVTVYAIPGDVSASAAKQVPVGGSTWRNLRCRSDATTGGSGITVTARSGTCAGTALTASSLTVTVTTANTVVADTTNTMAPTAGQCIQFSMVGSSTTTAASVTCTVERSA